jgi:hypothetical protein
MYVDVIPTRKLLKDNITSEFNVVKPLKAHTGFKIVFTVVKIFYRPQ